MSKALFPLALQVGIMTARLLSPPDRNRAMDRIERITRNPEIFGGKPIVRGRRLAVEHVLGMMAAGDTVDSLLEAYDWLEREDISACLEFAQRSVAGEEVIPRLGSES